MNDYVSFEMNLCHSPFGTTMQSTSASTGKTSKWRFYNIGRPMKKLMRFRETLILETVITQCGRAN